MRDERWTKVGVTFVLVLWWWLGAEVAYEPVGEVVDTIWEHLGWMVNHANVWHLAGNVFVLWCMKGRLHIAAGVAIAFICSWFPVLPGVWEMFVDGDTSATVGFSGVLCGMIGVKWGAWIKGCNDTAAYVTFGKRVLLVLLVGAFVPHINWSIHVYCVMVGLAYGRYKSADRC